MSDFVSTLSFSILPFLLVISFALVTPAMGAVLTLRNEIMLALALPSVANAAMAFGLLCGIKSENHAVIYLFTTAITLGVTLMATSGKNSARMRELRLAGMFAGGQICSLLFTAISPSAHAHIDHLLNGEVLAAGKIETLLILLGCIVLLSASIYWRKVLYGWCADEDFFRTGTRAYRSFILLTYTLMSATITIGVSTIGTLLVSALLVLPALMGDCGKGGINHYAIIVTLVGLTGSIAGFLCALVIDLPLAVCAAAGVGVVGLIIGTLLRFKS